uniref:Rab-GAP TBC domain-containing protein n=1 Tax=Leptocylindrus danicus TaxID=163516 RepID=A0A7S2KF21_9STRA|mmetsp:Transcript_2212/g.3251  ORF Transcript_2212/g.3251 Transcript_2212/m.3251 type:complete len:391 (+) Transcript_2212:157-1329(+)
MMRNWKNVNAVKRKKLKRRIRKGIPDAVRGHVWMEFCGVREKTEANPQVYELKHMIYGQKDIMETIERDIARTYPRHLFFADPSMSTTNQENSSHAGVTVASNEVSVATDAVANGSKRRLFCQADSNRILPSKETDVMVGSVIDAFSCKIKYTPTEDEQSIAVQQPPLVRTSEEKSGALEELLIEEALGQTLLRRVLRAYANYDEEVGYCQGMGFIAGMFLTYMPEEQAFWQLVGVMNEEPCNLRDLFSVGMAGAQQVLYVADKLTRKVLPKLAKHFDRENVHISMFATQWLVTIYTSNFPFDLVTRVWDCFLYEGWKVVYRVMLALLKDSSPKLLKMNFESILSYFRTLPEQVDGLAIMTVAFEIPLKRTFIQQYEKEWKDESKHNGNS